MSDTNANLNQSNYGNTPNWNNPQSPPQTGNFPQGTEQLGQPVTANGNVQAEELSLENPILDVLTVANQISTKFNVSQEKVTINYNSSINQPALTPSTVNDPFQANKTLQHISNPAETVMNDLVNNLASILPGNTTTLPEAAPLPGATTTPSTSEIPQVVVTDPQILVLAEKTGVAATVIQQNVQTETNSAFNAIVNTLPPDIANKLAFAQHVPEGVKNLSPELQSLLANINAQVKQQVAKDFGFTTDWPGVTTESTDFQAQLSISVDVGFETLLQEKVDAGTITASDAATLRAMHNGMATGSPTLKNILKQLEGQITTQLQAKYGFDVSYQPKGDVAAYNNIVNGDFAQTYQKNIAKYTGTATAEEIALLEKYAANPKDPSIPDHIKQLAAKLANERQLLLAAFPDPDSSSLPETLKAAAKQILAATKAEIVIKYGLDSTWEPTITSLYAPGVDPAAIKLANAALSTAQEILEQATLIGQSMAEGPEKTQFLFFLKAIGLALITLQEAIYGMQASQSQISKQLNRAKLETQLNDIDKQQRAADETKQKEGKMAGMGPVGKIFDWLFKIVILAVSITFGPLAFALALAYFIDSAVSEGMGNKETFTQTMFKEIAKTMPPAAASFVNLALATFLSVASCNVLLAINLITQDSQFMQNFVKACGGDELAQNVAAMVLNIVVQIVLMVVVTILTGGAATGALAAEVGAMVAKATGIALQTANKAVRIAMIVVQTVLMALQVAAEGVKLNNNILLSQIDIIKGQAEAYSEELQGILAAMKKVIEKLLSLLQGNSSMLTSISNFQGQKWSDASALSTELAG